MQLFKKPVESVLSANRNWFEFKLPKWLNAFSELQAYVFRRRDLLPGNYTYFSMQLDNSFLKSGLSVLMDYDIPASAIRKLEHLFPAENEWIDVEQRLEQLDLSSVDLLPYERKKLEVALRKQVS